MPYYFSLNHAENNLFPLFAARIGVLYEQVRLNLYSITKIHCGQTYFTEGEGAFPVDAPTGIWYNPFENR